MCIIVCTDTIIGYIIVIMCIIVCTDTSIGYIIIFMCIIVCTDTSIDSSTFSFFSFHRSSLIVSVWVVFVDRSSGPPLPLEHLEEEKGETELW